MPFLIDNEITGFIGRSNQSGGRPTMLVFGNSIASQNARLLVASTTTVDTETRSGSTVIPVAASSGFSVSDKVAIGLCSSQIHLSTVTAVDTVSTPKTITISDKLPQLVRSGASVLKYATDRPSGIRTLVGPLGLAIAKMGAPVDLIPGYGYGGSTSQQMLQDLPAWLRQFRPTYVALFLFENDIPGGASVASMQRRARAIATMCIKNGAIPILFTPVPSDYYSAGAQVSAFDSIKSYVLSIGSVVPGAIGIEFGTEWLDTGAPTLRKPLAGWTDGVHPVPAKKATIAEYIYSRLASVLGTGPAMTDYAIDSYDMSGTGGSTSGTGSITGSVAAGWTLYADSGVSVTASKTASDAQQIVMSVAGASNVSSTLVKLTRTVNLLNSAGGQWVKSYAKLKVNSASRISMLMHTVAFSDSTEHSAWQDSLAANDTAIVGNTYTIQGPTVRIPYGVTTYILTLWVRPETLGSPSGVSADIEVMEMGLLLDGAADTVIS